MNPRKLKDSDLGRLKLSLTGSVKDFFTYIVWVLLLTCYIFMLECMYKAYLVQPLQKMSRPMPPKVYVWALMHSQLLFRPLAY